MKLLQPISTAISHMGLHGKLKIQGRDRGTGGEGGMRRIEKWINDKTEWIMTVRGRGDGWMTEGKIKRDAPWVEEER